jgi:hypothetical protein
MHHEQCSTRALWWLNPEVGDIPKMQDQTQLLSRPSPLILGTPPLLGFTQHKQTPNAAILV